MKSRNKFIVVQIEDNFDKLSSIFNATPYSEATGIGIISKGLSVSSFSATFIEKKKVYEDITYPDGHSETIERLRYVYLDFKIARMSSSHYLFTIKNPPFSLKSFINFLSKLFFRLTIEKYTFDLKKFNDAIRSNERLQDCRVVSLKASSVPFSDKSVARLEIFSERDAYKELKKIYGDKQYRLDRLVYLISNREASSTVAVSSAGTAYFESDDHEEIIIESFITSITF